MQPPKAANNITCMGLCCHLAWPYSSHIKVLSMPATRLLQWPCMQQRKESQRLSRSLRQCCKTWHLLFAKWGGDNIHFCTISPSEMAPPLLSNRDTCMGLCCHLAWPYSAHINVLCKTPPINSNGLACNKERNPKGCHVAWANAVKRDTSYSPNGVATPFIFVLFRQVRWRLPYCPIVIHAWAYETP